MNFREGRFLETKIFFWQKKEKINSFKITEKMQFQIIKDGMTLDTERVFKSIII